MTIIDPPSSFAPLAEWQAFLDEMLSLQAKGNTDPEVAAAIEEAREEIATLEAAEGS